MRKVTQTMRQLLEMPTAAIEGPLMVTFTQTKPCVWDNCSHCWISCFFPSGFFSLLLMPRHLPSLGLTHTSVPLWGKVMSFLFNHPILPPLVALDSGPASLVPSQKILASGGFSPGDFLLSMQHHFSVPFGPSRQFLMWSTLRV